MAISNLIIYTFEVLNLNFGIYSLNFLTWMLDYRFWNLVFEFVFWHLQLDFWNLEFGIWNLESGIWNLALTTPILKILIIIGLTAIFYQDFKERKVYLSLLLITGIFLSLMHFTQVNNSLFFTSITINSIIILLIILILYIYSNYKLKKSLKETLGTGDILFFFIMGVSFPIISFLILFIFSIFFAGILYVILRKRIKDDAIPLAGFQALFLVLVFLVNWSFQISNIYAF